MITRRLALGAALALPALGAGAQGLRTARILIGFPPGGLTDAQARLLAQKLQGSYADTIIVENKAGASGRLALETVKAAEADGSTMVLTPTDHVVLFPHLYPTDLRYDAFGDFHPVSMLSIFHMSISAGPSCPARTFQELLAWGRGQESIPFGNPGAGTLPHFLGIELARATGLKLTAVPYRGDGPAVQDCLAGQIPLTLNSMPAVQPFVTGSPLKVLATTAPRRSVSAPEVPTIAELGQPGLGIYGGTCVLLPARTPAARVAALDHAIGRFAAQADNITSLVRLGVVPEYQNGAQLAAWLRREHQKWGPIVASSGYRPND